jgi:TPR repeat protein
MVPGALRRACVEFRSKLSRDTGANLSAAVCEDMLATTFNGGQVSLQSDPGLFYASMGSAITAQSFALDLRNRSEVACWCYREAAEVHMRPEGMVGLAGCYYTGDGVGQDTAQAYVWYQKAADLGDLGAKATLGAFLVSSELDRDAARGFTLLREAVDQGYGEALYPLAHCYLKGCGVEKDAAQGVALLRQYVNLEDDRYGTDTKALVETALAICYMTGDGVEADTVQAALWCQRAATGGWEQAIEMLSIIRTCNFCGTTPARKHCERCRKMRYCNTTCQAAHWNRDTDPHKGHCRRAAPGASQQEAGGTSTSAQ